jgi:hypothetical protein
MGLKILLLDFRDIGLKVRFYCCKGFYLDCVVMEF